MNQDNKQVGYYRNCNTTIAYPKRLTKAEVKAEKRSQLANEFINKNPAVHLIPKLLTVAVRANLGLPSFATALIPTPTGETKMFQRRLA